MRAFLALALILSSRVASGQPETVVVPNATTTLHAMLWRPQGRGPFPAILFNHGSARTREELQRLGPYEKLAETIGPVFARHGYVFLFLFRPGVGLSAGQEDSAADLMNREAAAHGQDGRNRLQLQLMENREMNAAVAGLAFLGKLPGVDAHRLAIVAHSFGGSLSILQAAKEPDLRALVIFSSAGYSWDRSPELRTRLLAAAAHLRAPVFLIHAANDYSLHPGKDLDARLAQLDKPHRLKIYPPIGKTPDDGHNFPFLGVKIWEPDVFAFLDEYLRK